MTAMSEAYTFSASDGAMNTTTSDGVISAIMVGFPSSETMSWKTYESDEVGVTNNERAVLTKRVMSLRFSLLRERWYRERGPTSSISHIVRCDSYQQIVKMGKEALPLILAQLKLEGDNPDHWFIALESITGKDPIPENAYGNMLKMAEAWFFWAEENNVW